MHHTDNHFKLSKSIKDFVENMPKPEKNNKFKLIQKNDYELIEKNKINVTEIDFSCDCTKLCDENCLNRILNYECCEPIKASKNAAPMCNVGVNCTNRVLQKKIYADVEVFKEYDFFLFIFLFFFINKFLSMQI
jgi:hypothetical protein